MRKSLLLVLCATLWGINAVAQGNNTRMCGDENDETESLAERAFNLEKKAPPIAPTAWNRASCIASSAIDGTFSPRET